LLLTSRVSIDLVQKAAIAAIPLVAAVSGPTHSAIRAADGAGITLVGVARDDGFEIFCRPARIMRCGARTIEAAPAAERQVSRGKAASLSPQCPVAPGVL